jgi:hypothetical protein
MRFAAFSRIAACIVGISCSFAPMTSGASNCKCPKNPGPGGGVQCAKDQVATCDPSSGECNCTCDSVQAGKTKAEYEAQILSTVLHAKIDPSELSSDQYRVPVSSFRKSYEANGTFTFDKEENPAGRSRNRGQVTVGVPEWLEKVLGRKGGVSIGPGASLQNCPNGMCIGGENRGPATVNNPTGSIVNQNSTNLGAQTVNNTPPSRIPSDEQIIHFKSIISRVDPKFTVRIFPAGSGDDVEPTVEKIANALHDLERPVNTAGYIGFGGGPIATAEGIECYSTEWDSPDLQQFLKAMEVLGLKCKVINHARALVGESEVTIARNGGVTVLIGRQPR